MSDARRLFSVSLDYTVDVEWSKNRTRALIIKNDNPITSGRDVSVIDCRHVVLMSIGCAHRKGSKRHALQSLPDFVYHAGILD
jgi:hypothetical protein